MTRDTDDSARKPDNAADIAFVKALAEVLRDNDLGELQVERGSKHDTKLSVRISKSAPVAQAPAVVSAPPPSSESTAPAPAAAPPVRAPLSDDPANLPGAVTSPMVGTAYLASEPGSPQFVSVGDTVSEGQTLLIVEAMKTMNQIPSPRAGTVKRILVEDGAPVEYGAPLMVVE